MKGASFEVRRNSFAVYAVLVAAVIVATMGASAAFAAPFECSLTTPLAGPVAGVVPVSAISTMPAGQGTAILMIDGVESGSVAEAGILGHYLSATTWDSSSVSNGPHTVGLAVGDSAFATVTVTADVNVENPDVTGVLVSPSTISPNNDGNTDVTTISYTLATTSTVTVLVKDSHGTVVGTPLSAVTQFPGARSTTWDGLVSGKPDLPNGTYTVYITASHLGVNVTKSDTVNISVMKSTTGSIKPSAATFKLGTSVKAYVKLDRWAYLQVGVYNTSDKLVKTLLVKTLKNPSWRYTYTWNGRNSAGSKCAPGLYTLKAIVTNQGGAVTYTSSVRIKGIKWLLLVRNLLRIYLLEGVVYGNSGPLPGPKWADWKVNGQRVAVFPLAMGMNSSRWRTPLGKSFIEKKAVWPVWYPPSWAGQSGPVPGGRSNPLGPRALYLSPNGYVSGIRIHGTNNPSSIGTYASHGCCRMFPKDVIWLYNQVPVGTRVQVSANMPRGVARVGPNKPSAPHLRNY
jgi:flagellar hook assembly protein FlgD